MPNSLIVLVDEIVAVLEVLPFADGVMVRLDRSELRLRFAYVDDSREICTPITVSKKQAIDSRNPPRRWPSSTRKLRTFCVTKSFRNSFLLPNTKARVDNDEMQAVRVDQLTSQA